MEIKTFITKSDIKLNKLIKEEDFSFSTFSKAIKNKDVKINGKKTADMKAQLLTGDRVDIYYSLADKKEADICIIYKDENVLVVDKKAGITSDNFYAEILSKYSGAKFIHRLDRNTSGIMIFALNLDAEKALLEGFKNRDFIKLYFTEVCGKLQEKNAVLTAYLKKDSEKAQVSVFDKKVEGSVQIKTGYKVIKENPKSTELEVELFTGKTHQIRAHLAHIGHPIIGDGKYGSNIVNKEFKAQKQRLISWKLTLKFNEQSPLFYLSGKTFVSMLKGE